MSKVFCLFTCLFFSCVALNLTLCAGGLLILAWNGFILLVTLIKEFVGDNLSLWDLKIFCLYLLFLFIWWNLQQEFTQPKLDKRFHNHWKVHSNFRFLSCTAILAIHLIEFKICSLSSPVTTNLVKSWNIIFLKNYAQHS